MVESEYRSAVARLDDLRAMAVRLDQKAAASGQQPQDRKQLQEFELLTYQVRFYEHAHMGGQRPDEAKYIELLRTILADLDSEEGRRPRG